MKFCTNKASELDVADHLRHCDASFIPPLSGRVKINAYAGKIVGQAMRFEAWAQGTLVGLLAVYCNDDKKKMAYITNVSVLHDWAGRGIASQLLDQCIELVRQLGFDRVELEVDKENAVAIGLYEKKGFRVGKVGGRIMGRLLIKGWKNR